MTEEIRTLVIEKEFTHPPEKLWRALTQPHLIAEWLMQNDFEPTVGRDFKLRMDHPAVEGRHRLQGSRCRTAAEALPTTGARWVSTRSSRSR